MHAGINLVGLDGTLYDQVLDTIFYLGLAPARFSVSFFPRSPIWLLCRAFWQPIQALWASLQLPWLLLAAVRCMCGLASVRQSKQG